MLLLRMLHFALVDWTSKAHIVLFWLAEANPFSCSGLSAGRQRSGFLTFYYVYECSAELVH